MSVYVSTNAIFLCLFVRLAMCVYLRLLFISPTLKVMVAFDTSCFSDQKLLYFCTSHSVRLSIRHYFCVSKFSPFLHFNKVAPLNFFCLCVITLFLFLFNSGRQSLSTYNDLFYFCFCARVLEQINSVLLIPPATSGEHILRFKKGR